MGKNQHVIPVEGRWAVKAEGASDPSHTVGTQQEAFEIGRDIVKKERSELLNHGEDGKIRERNTYGKYPPEG